jgi:RNA polymerase sigma-70 factor (ECF subfamily)
MSSSENEVREETVLLVAAGRGDRAAFRGLYAHFSAPLFSLALRLVGDAGAAEEVLQDTFVKIWRHAAAYDARKSQPFTWAVTILRRTAIDHLRRHRRAPVLDVLAEADANAAELSIRESARATAEAHEASDRVRGLLAAIEQPRRSALELALFSTLTHAEIATRLAQPAGTVKTWIRRGLLELRQTLSSATP